jgi:hypothetical protein
MKWLTTLLQQASNQVDLRDPEDRELLAESIILSIPRDLLAAAIASSAAAVMRVAGLERPDLAREIGNNAAQSVLVLLQIDGDPDNELAIPERTGP